MKRIFQRSHLAFILGMVLLWSCSDDPDDMISGELPAIDLLDDSYGPEPIQSINVYLPAGRNPQDTPLFIYIHGGAWIDGDKTEFDAFRGLAETYFPDYAYVSIGYRLHTFGTTVNTFPTQENDIISAIQYIVSQTETWNVSDDIVLAGASAGGHLALLHGYKHSDVGDLKGIFTFFPPTEMTALSEFNFVTQLGLSSLTGGSPIDVPNVYSESSPVNFIASSSLPSIFFHGTTDAVVPISQSELLANMLESRGVDHEYVVYPGQGHGFDAVTYASAFEQAAEFMKKYLP